VRLIYRAEIRGLPPKRRDIAPRPLTKAIMKAARGLAVTAVAPQAARSP
jgi:hypothetical protein